MTDLNTRIREFIYREAELLDDKSLTEWLGLFASDGIYWIPIDDSQSPQATASLIHDDAISREERVHHLLHLSFPAQSPPSRTVHFVSNVRQVDENAGIHKVRSSQLIYETRPGDHTQLGLGNLCAYVATVEHQLQEVEGELKIKLKKILLINRDMPLGNMTFLL